MDSVQAALSNFVKSNPCPDKRKMEDSPWLLEAALPILPKAKIIQIQGVYAEPKPNPVIIFEFMKWEGLLWCDTGIITLSAAKKRVETVFRNFGDKSEIKFKINLITRPESLQALLKNTNRRRASFLFSTTLPVIEEWQENLKQTLNTVIEKNILENSLPTSIKSPSPPRL